MIEKRNFALHTPHGGVLNFPKKFCIFKIKLHTRDPLSAFWLLLQL